MPLTTEPLWSLVAYRAEFHITEISSFLSSTDLEKVINGFFFHSRCYHYKLASFLPQPEICLLTAASAESCCQTANTSQEKTSYYSNLFCPSLGACQFYSWFCHWFLKHLLLIPVNWFPSLSLIQALRTSGSSSCCSQICWWPLIKSQFYLQLLS